MFNWSLGEQRACGAETRFKEMIWELRKNDENQQATRLKAQQIQNRVHYKD